MPRNFERATADAGLELLEGVDVKFCLRLNHPSQYTMFILKHIEIETPIYYTNGQSSAHYIYDLQNTNHNDLQLFLI